MRLSAPIIMTWLISHPDNAYTARVLDAIHTHGTTEFLALLDSGDYPLPPEDVFATDDRRKVVVPGPWTGS